MQDTFTKVIPLYNHYKTSCHIPSQTHKVHKEFAHDILGKHIAQKDLGLHHKMDVMKTYNEEMLKLPNFAPLPRTNPVRDGNTWHI